MKSISVTGVTSVTTFMIYVLSTFILVLQVLQVLQPSFSMSLYEINQRYRCYKRYSLHFWCLLIKSTCVTGVTCATAFIFYLSSHPASVTSVTASFSNSSHQINQCYKCYNFQILCLIINQCYKCYNFQILCLIIVIIIENSVTLSPPPQFLIVIYMYSHNRELFKFGIIITSKFNKISFIYLLALSIKT